MNKSIGYGAASLAALALLVVTARQASTQVGGSLPAFVKLQATTPGTAQTGNNNVTGTSIAGQYVGGGAGLTGVNADLLDGLNSTAFLQSIPNPLTLTGDQPGSHIVKGENAATSNNSSGVFGHATGNSSLVSGVFGQGFTGVKGFSSGSGGRGVSGAATASTGISYGGIFQNLSSSGTGVLGWATASSGEAYGVHGQSESNSGQGVRGIAGSSTGVNYGGYFENRSSSGEGVRGINISTSGGATGGYFLSASVSARALYGLAYATSGTTYGVVGQSNSASGGYGVWGTSSANGWAVYAAGHLGASGTKAFRIDHPSDPENKYLLHYSTESPEPMNFYSGVTFTDAQGAAWVQLPDYFSEINKDFRYTLTVVDDTDSNTFVQAKVAREIRDNRFKIRTSGPRVKVSWRVEAVRNDRWVQKHGAPVVVEKQGPEKGTYQHPELYGKPASMGMDNDPKSPVAGEDRVGRP